MARPIRYTVKRLDNTTRLAVLTIQDDPVGAQLVDAAGDGMAASTLYTDICQGRTGAYLAEDAEDGRWYRLDGPVRMRDRAFIGSSAARALLSVRSEEKPFHQVFDADTY